ncbi:hypothetical protein PTSG_01036 [Salpingoeca rosetta]|uniref:Uncharacterized protein n=1 Tax=Salpingoeca rosetta (strain ATCC 50818 / BSB-021) TaxID=946362 RepID=F2TY77_SALR5|nr:uncharacterized protein PTSG_01036 [Salpingoeca rosetta]EGD76336.1 hypothetical protein PTSG_01036 [Salpingoeca rosetta]|eukprot:XP_004998511.1 hypothetical protein PTSG_01036 [Salpingoeca rosetta]
MQDLRAIDEFTSISSFILPFCYTKWISDVVWVKPPHAVQIPSGCYSIPLGHIKQDAGDTTVYIGSQLEYFVRENLYRPPEDLLDVRVCRLHVVDITMVLRSGRPLDCTCNIVERRLQSRHRPLLDICLDTFSANNPFKVKVASGLGSACYDKLASSYSATLKAVARRSCEHAISSCCLVCRQQRQLLVLRHLQSLWTCDSTPALEANMASLVSAVTATSSGADLEEDRHDTACAMEETTSNLRDVWRLWMSSKAAVASQSLSPWFMHLAGQMHDLPHFSAPTEERNRWLAALRRLCECMLAYETRPSVCTIASSQDDGYTSPVIVEETLAEVLKVLHEVLHPCRQVAAEDAARMTFSKT